MTKYKGVRIPSARLRKNSTIVAKTTDVVPTTQIVSPELRGEGSHFGCGRKTRFVADSQNDNRAVSQTLPTRGDEAEVGELNLSSGLTDELL